MKAALEPSASPSASSDRGDREAYLAALFRSPLGFERNESFGGRLPRVVECLDAPRERRPTPETGGAWREEDSHASVLVAECAALLARDLRSAGGLSDGRVDPRRRARVGGKPTRGRRGRDDDRRVRADSLRKGTASTASTRTTRSARRSYRRRKERARLAKARQAAVLAAMAARQKAFADTLREREDDDRSADEEGDDDAVRTAAERTDFKRTTTTSARTSPMRSSAETVKDETVKLRTRTRRLAWDPVPECALCGDDEAGGDAGKLCWLARRQRAFAPSAGRAFAKRREKSKTVVPSVGGRRRFFRSAERETHQTHDSSDDEDAFETSVDALECVGFLPVTCGHGAHAACLDRYVRSTHARADGDEAMANETANATDPNETRRAEREASTGLCGFEFRCPACRRVCDVVVPALAATPSQLELQTSQTSQTSNGEGPRSKRHFSVPETKDASSIDAALVATVNGLARPKPVKSVTNTADDERRLDEGLDERLDERLDF